MVRGSRYFFDGTYAEFSKIPILPPTPPQMKYHKRTKVLFKICPGDPTPFFSNKKYPFTFQILLKTPPTRKFNKPKKSTNYALPTNSIMICTVCHQHSTALEVQHGSALFAQPCRA